MYVFKLDQVACFLHPTLPCTGVFLSATKPSACPIFPLTPPLPPQESQQIVNNLWTKSFCTFFCFFLVIEDWGLKIEDCGLRIEECGLRIAGCGSEGITPDNPPPPPPGLSHFSWKTRGGLSGRNFFMRDFLTKKFSGASRRRKEGGRYLEWCLLIEDWRLRIADWGLRIEDWGLRIEECGLRIADQKVLLQIPPPPPCPIFLRKQGGGLSGVMPCDWGLRIADQKVLLQIPPPPALPHFSWKRRGGVIWSDAFWLRIKDWRLRIADCGLRIEDCGLRNADCGSEDITPDTPPPHCPIFLRKQGGGYLEWCLVIEDCGLRIRRYYSRSPPALPHFSWKRRGGYLEWCLLIED